jgi:hypothetical protein
VPVLDSCENTWQRRRGAALNDVRKKPRKTPSLRQLEAAEHIDPI